MIGEVRRQMHADEHYLEAADEKADREEHVPAMAERLGHRLARRLLESVRLTLTALDHRSGKRRHQQADGRQRDQGGLPAHIRQQPLRQRQQRELTERSRRGGDAERHAALFRRKGAAEDA